MKCRALRFGSVVAVVLISSLGALRPWLMPQLCKQAFISDIQEYEEYYRRNSATCYGLWNPDIESLWFWGMDRDDYARAASELCRHQDPIIRTWATRVLVIQYADTPWAREFVFGLLVDRTADIQDRVVAALVVIDWGQLDRIVICSEIFQDARMTSSALYLGRRLYEAGYPQALYQKLDDPDASLEDKRLVARMLMDHGDQTRIDAIKDLCDAMETGDWRKCQMASYLALIGDQQYARIALRELESMENALREKAIDRLIAFAKAYPERLDQLEHDSDPAIRKGCAILRSRLK